MERRLFGTDGIRGIAGEYPLDERTLFACGVALVRVLGGRARLVLGRDTRESGPWIERHLRAGVRAAGGEVISVGVFTTPGIAYLVRALGDVDAGVVISASHNPYRDNGIKIFSADGTKWDEARERALEREVARLHADPDLDRMYERALRAEEASERASPQTSAEPFRALYLRFLREEVAGVRSGERPLRGWRVAMDCAHGAAYQMAPMLFVELGAEVEAVGVEPDGRNINDSCGALHPDVIRHVVRERRCDLGIAFDGDADRVLFVGPDGEVYDGDDALYILATYWHERGRLRGDLVVGTEMTNFGLERALARRGIALVRARVGDRYVMEKMREHGASLGGEPSGHIIVSDVSPTGDGLVTALLLVNIMRETGRTLAELRKGWERVPQRLVNVRVREKPPLETISELSRALAEARERLRERGRVLVRYSGTEPVARVMVEGEDEKLVGEIAGMLADVLSRHLGAE